MKEMVAATTMPIVEHRSERKVTYKPKEKVGFKGVFKCGRKFKAQIQINRVRHYLGLYDTEMEAARAYDEHARTVLGPKARLNLPTAAEKAQESANDDSDGNSEGSKPKQTPAFGGGKLTRHYAVPGSKKSTSQSSAAGGIPVHVQEPAMYAHHFHGMPMPFQAMPYAQAMSAMPHGAMQGHPHAGAWFTAVPSSSGTISTGEPVPVGSVGSAGPAGTAALPQQDNANHTQLPPAVQEQMRFYDQYQMMQAYMMSRQPFLMQYPPGAPVPYQYVNSMPGNFSQQFAYDPRMGMMQQGGVFQNAPPGQYFTGQQQMAPPLEPSAQDAGNEGNTSTSQVVNVMDTSAAKTPTVDVVQE